MGNGMFLFKMPTPASKRLALSRKIWHVGPCPLYVSEWSPFHDPAKPPLTKFSTWISLRGIPHQLFNFDCLSRLVTGIGTPIYLDKATATKENLTVARIYAEVDATSKLPHKLAASLPTGHVARYCPTVAQPKPQQDQNNHSQNQHETMTKGTKKLVEDKITQQPAASTDQEEKNQENQRQRSTKATATEKTEESHEVYNQVLKNEDNKLDHAKSSPNSQPQSQPVEPPKSATETTGKRMTNRTAAKTHKAEPGDANSTRGRKATRNRKTHIREPNAVRGLLAFPNGWKTFCNYADDRSGRILVGWDPSATVTIYQTSAQAVTCGFHHPSLQWSFTATFVYADNSVIERKRLWQQIKELSIYPLLKSTPWIVLGDFNQTLTPSDRSDYPISTVAPPSMTEFVEYRILGNQVWLTDHYSISAEFGNPGPSDHAPGIVRLPSTMTRTVSDCWGENSTTGTAQFLLCSRLKMLKSHLRRLNKTSFSDISKRTQEAYDKLTTTQAALFESPSTALAIEEQRLRRHWNILAAAEERFYKQKLKKLLGVTGLDNYMQGLLSIPTAAEVQKTLTSMPNNKAPGPDGYPKEFYVNTWSIVGDGLVKAVQEFFSSGQMLGQINATMISLIPKRTGADSLSDFRPISCCNTIYKIISSILASRLKPILEKLISRNQAAFLKRRLMLENILLAAELIRDYNRPSAQPQAMLKIDIRKAFDTIKWSFITKILHAIGLPTTFVGWIKTCITTPKFSISVNGEPAGYFPGGRGLRQGDPISPYLFILSMEVLSRMLDESARQGKLKPQQGCVDPLITHLSFADDVIIFSAANRESITEIKDVLYQFESFSGLKINQSKSDLFICGLPEAEASNLTSLLGIRRGNLPIRYLGVPLSPWKLSKQDYQPLLDKINSKIQSWTTIFLSYAGKVDSICAKFLWKSGNTGAHRVSWANICLPKMKGGLGLRKLEDINTSARLKLVWLLFANSGSLWVAWVRKHLLKRCQPEIDYIDGECRRRRLAAYARQGKSPTNTYSLNVRSAHPSGNITHHALAQNHRTNSTSIQIGSKPSGMTPIATSEP
ncbi:PREDICTED: uncharacterized protein LOC104817082 [Tarenaya hassleriana]|uniref:uncharacterized protein LOC104817082 n=1 Tax=Tarenaya hassleriana TaxID=28532 RepID=UPI00053C4768|nr:PREDICTED: uncharacterized protein LOC104817082 [Tarenaya hassleriana]